MSFWWRRSKSKVLEREVKADVRNCLTFAARVGLKEILRKDWMSAKSAANVWIVVWMFRVSLGSGGWPDFAVAIGIVVNFRVMVFCRGRGRKRDR